MCSFVLGNRVSMEEPKCISSCMREELSRFEGSLLHCIRSRSYWSDSKNVDLSYLRWHGIIAASVLLLLDVLLVDHLLLLLGSEAVLGWDTAVSRHGCLLGRNLGVADIVGGTTGVFAINTVLIVCRGFGCIQTCLIAIKVISRNQLDRVRDVPG